LALCVAIARAQIDVRPKGAPDALDDEADLVMHEDPSVAIHNPTWS
jgi:hypothetical protein